MFKKTAHHLNETGDVLNRKLESRYAIYAVMAVVTTLFVIAAAMIGISSYSPDSWAYFELSKTVFSGDFYRFNTFRSYFSNEYSAAFPLGYPVVLALVSLWTGPILMLAVAINIATVGATGLLLFNICKRIAIPAVAAVALILSVLFYPPYFDEVFTGRAIPLAMLIFLTACHFHLLKRPLLAGIFLGVSALVRFDFLVFAVLFQAVVFFLEKSPRLSFPAMPIGFVFGILPWVVYSYTHFGKLWASDNSWVALSALPAFVLDYPAEAWVTAFQDPARWFMKIFDNTAPLAESILSSAPLYPLLIFSLFFTALNWVRLRIENKSKTIILIIVIVISTAPYLLTGYIDPRYYSLLFLSLSATLVFVNGRNVGAEFLAGNFFGWMLVSLIFTIFIGTVYLFRDALVGARRTEAMTSQHKLIQTLKVCHQFEPQTVYIFMKEAGFVAPRYGAVSGMRIAYIPSNFERMTEGQRAAYLDQMKPYKLFASLLQVEQCTNR